MIPAQLKVIQDGLALHKQQRFHEAETEYHKILNQEPDDQGLLYLLADIYLRRDWNGLAGILLTNLVKQNPKHGPAWCNLGLAYRKENRLEIAKAAWDRALAIDGDTEEVCNNMAGLYADMANPAEAIAWTDRALKVNPDSVPAHWHKALALLTLGRFDEGWPLYRSREKKEGWHARDSVDAPQWDGKPVERLYIHGEQGVGDEIMFASSIPHILDRVGHVTIEVNAKVAGIVKQTWPKFTVVKEESQVSGRFDAKVPIGNLIGMFGMNPKPFLEPHPEKVAFYRRELEQMGPGPYVALTWVGGTKATRIGTRSMDLGELAPIMDRYTCVSAQYSQTPALAENIAQQLGQYGLRKINEESAGEDLHDQAALFKAVDAVVTVQQTAVHVAGGVGAKTLALIDTNPHWRYGISGDVMPFYSSVRLLRKKTDWKEVVERALDALDREL